MRIERSFFERDTLTVARELIGQVITAESPDGTVRGVIVETEAYLGTRDDAAHTYKGRTERTVPLFGPKGCAYVYMIYGMYYCLNISAGLGEDPDCVLIRALRPAEGLDLMAGRRRTDKAPALCSGPGKLCMAMGIGREDSGEDLCSGAGRMYLEYGDPPEKVAATPRIGIDYAEKCRGELWRCIEEGSPWVSRGAAGPAKKK